MCDSGQEDGWVVCRVFKKKNYNKTVDQSPQRSSSAPSIDSTPQMQSLKDLNVHDQFLAYINGRESCKQETDSLANIITTHNYNSMQQLMNPIKIQDLGLFDQDSRFQAHDSMIQLLTKAKNSRDHEHEHEHEHLDNWADVDRLVASQLNGQPRSLKHMYACYNESNDQDMYFPLDHDDQESPHEPSCMAKPNDQAAYTSEIDLWSFAQSSSQSSSPDPFYHLSV